MRKRGGIREGGLITTEKERMQMRENNYRVSVNTERGMNLLLSCDGK